MKAYTDLEQSKKLAEILPLESADMYYEEVCNLPKAIVGNYILHNQNMEDKDYKKLSNPVLSPAWSLAALFSFIREIIGYEVLCLDRKTITIKCELGDKPWSIEVNKSNEIDACVNMIIKLHEQNLL